ncbi:hypothetical protein D9M73_65480 [compost metagenome]
MPAVGDEGFASIQYIVRAIGAFQGRGLDALQVAAGGGFAHGNGAHHFTAGEAGQVFALLRFGAVMQDIGRHDFAVQAKADAGEARAAYGFDLGDRVEFFGARAAVFFRQAHAQETVLAGPGPYGAVNVTLLLPGGMVGCDFLFDETVETFGKGLVVGVEQGAVDHGGGLSDKKGRG